MNKSSTSWTPLLLIPPISIVKVIILIMSSFLVSFMLQRSSSTSVSALPLRSSVTSRRAFSSVGSYRRTMTMYAEDGQAEVVLVGCGAPNRGMGWYHAVQMLDKK
jgi:hypothetical protein